jgi:hypothetical protein
MSLYFPSISPRSSGSQRFNRQYTSDIDLKVLGLNTFYTTDMLTKTGGTTLSKTWTTNIDIKRLAASRKYTVDTNIINLRGLTKTFNTDISIVTPAGTGSSPTITNVITILMENQSWPTVLSSGNAPWLTSMLVSGSSIPNYNLNTYYPGSSEASYVAMVSGDTYGASDGTRGIGNASTVTLANRFESVGVNWHVIQNGTRGGDHNGFLDFNSVVNTPTRISHCVAGTEQDLLTYVAGITPTQLNYVAYTPADNQNMHDNSVSSGDAYLKSFVPQLLTSPCFTQGRAILMIWWDEWEGGASTLTNANLFLGSVKQNYLSPNFYQHYDVLRMYEQILGLTPMSNGPDFPPGDIGANTALGSEILT